MEYDHTYIVLVNGKIEIELMASSTILALEGALSYIKANYKDVHVTSLKVL